ncbi:MAG: nickel-dependent hydrogenase large subunit [Burkholderiaceae bacterium]|nr:nickel-dependent hydrogenase large subunit [Burkholderiaceae bacterium]
MSRLIVGPFNRVEGDLEVQLELADDRVVSARVNAPMYRGFEALLAGRDPQDALVIVPRICGICSVSQSVAAARALADAAGLEPARNGRLAIELMLACENLADHLTHFYLFFLPDFTRPVYDQRPWYCEARRRFAAASVSGQGEQARRATAARQRWFMLMGLLGGKWPHSGSIQPGGSSRSLEAAERLRLRALLQEFRAFLEEQLFGQPLEAVAAWQREDELPAPLALPAGVGAWRDASDLQVFLTLSADLALDRLGRGPDLYLSHGSHQGADGRWLQPPGVWDAAAGSLRPFDPGEVHEDLQHAWLGDPGSLGAAAPRHPFEGVTLPQPDKPGAYSWNKAPRLAGRVLQTGALARQLVAGQPLLQALTLRCGGTVQARVLARLLELAQVLPWMEQTLAGLSDGEPWCHPVALPREGRGVGLVEAARGALGHWTTLQQGRIANYQIVAPTSWNFSPRDAQGRPGALEAALVGAPLRPGETTPVAVQHIVRSFDPCMVCTVH